MGGGGGLAGRGGGVILIQQILTVLNKLTVINVSSYTYLRSKI